MCWPDPNPEARDRRFRQVPRSGFAPFMTCGELIAFLQDFPPSMAVLLGNDGWYSTLGSVEGPIRDGDDWTDDETGYILPTLFPGDSFDCRYHV